MPVRAVQVLMPDDWHVHGREEELLLIVLPFTSVQFRQALYMPNLSRAAIVNALLAGQYRGEIMAALDSVQPRPKDRHKAYCTMYLTPKTTAEDVYACARLGIIAAKYYPHGGTTNSGSGLSTPRDIKPEVLATMQEVGMILCLHGEVTPDVQPDKLLREYDFIPHLMWLLEQYPDLKCVVEHVSDRRMAERVLDATDMVAMSVTGHHPFTTASDADKDVHSACMPYAKTPEDRDYLAELILQAHELPKVFFGSDSAPHLMPGKAEEKKHGVFSSPVAIPVLWEHFSSSGDATSGDAFEAFMCLNGARFYGRELTKGGRGRLLLLEEAWEVPESYQGLVPWKHGETLLWRVYGMEWFGKRV